MSGPQGSSLPCVAAKTLPSALHLPDCALSPTTPSLVLLTSPPDATTEPKVVLYRLAASSADLVWEWTPPPPPAPAPTGKFGGLKGKAKAQTNGGKIEGVEWRPDGQAVAVISSHASAPPSLTILSIHSGQPLLPAASLLPRPSSTACTLATWQNIASPANLRTEPWALRIIHELPALPKIDKGAIAAAGAEGPGSGPGGGIGGARIGGPAGGGGGGGVFGAKQAMLERERAKEAQRPLNLREAAPRFPTLLPAHRLEESSDECDSKVLALLSRRSEPDAAGRDQSSEPEQTIACVCGQDGDVQLLLGGSIHLGSIAVGGRALAVTPLPPSTASPSSSSFAIRLAIHIVDASDQLLVKTITVPVPATLELVVRQSTALRAILDHAFEALQESRNLWDEARRIGKGWLQRLADISRPHAVTQAPATQLHLLLVTGRPTRALHDFLASKLNERGLVKWEQAMAAALERLREVGWMSVTPALERVVLLLREVDAWARWPQRFGEHEFYREEVQIAVAAASEGIRAMARLQREAEEEERCFKHFRAWLHYELEKVAAQEGSETRPTAHFHPIPVSHYIQHRLPPTATTLSPYLSFGLAAEPLTANADLRAVEAWLDTTVGSANGGETSAAPPGSSASQDVHSNLGTLLKRLRQELRGQIDAEKLEEAREAEELGALAAEDIERAVRRPYAEVQPDSPLSLSNRSPRPSAPYTRAETRDEAESRPSEAGSTESAPPRSLPALLHTLARLSGNLFAGTVSRVSGDRALISDLGSGRERPGAKKVRARVVTAADASSWLCEFISETVHFSRVPVGTSAESLAPQAAHALLARGNDSPAEVQAIEFEGDDTVLVAFSHSTGGGELPVV
ncbi:hypothetical protein JCM8202_003987 [Rhodotorula sphaerocarpa]